MLNHIGAHLLRPYNYSIFQTQEEQESYENCKKLLRIQCEIGDGFNFYINDDPTCSNKYNFKEISTSDGKLFHLEPSGEFIPVIQYDEID